MGISWSTVAVSLVGQLLIAWFTVRFALNRFRQEKWWERKYEAYTEIIKALHQMKRNFADSLNKEETNKDRTEEQEIEFANAYKEAQADLMRHSDFGDFLLSQHTVEIFKEFGKYIKDASITDQSYYEYLEANFSLIATTLDKIRAEAKRDLIGRPM